MEEAPNRTDHGESQKEERKPESKGMRVIRIMMTIIAFSFFALIIIGAIARKLGG